VIITGTGTINVAGAYASAIYGYYGIAGTITNNGLLEAPNGYGVFLKSGGTITNGSTLAEGAKITGGVDAVKLGIHGPGTVNNFGTIASTGTAQGIGVLALGSASVVNGSTADTSALISGYFDGVQINGSGAAVSNFGTILATGTSTVVGSSSFGVYLTKGGTITNGSSTDTKASIVGSLFSVEIAHGPGKVINFGVIKSTGPLGRGVLLEDGGAVINNIGAYIGASNRNGVYIGGPGAGTVTNLGTIHGARTGVVIATGGTVTNGSNTDKTAQIYGARSGVYVAGLLPSSVNNFGTIANVQAHPAVNLYLGGHVTNGSASDFSALISGGGTGIYAGGLSTITNFGTIFGATNGIGLRGGGTIVNGSVADKTAKIASTGTVGAHSAIYDNGGLTTITNFGTITSATASGVHLNNGGRVTNGSTADTAAAILGATGHAGMYFRSGTVNVVNFGSIKGATGVSFTNGTASATGIVNNFGSIVSTTGTTGTAIAFGSGNDQLIVHPGAFLGGTVAGGGGANVLEFASGASAGSMTGVGSQFTGFQKGVVDLSATWNVTGTNSIATLTNNGTLGFNPAGKLTVTGAVDPASSGVFLLENSGVLEVAADKGHGNQMQFMSPSELIVDTAANFGINVGSTLYTGPLIKSFGTGDNILLKNIAFAGAVLNYSTATGLLQVTGSGIATLHFESLGAGSFHPAADGSGHLIITHS
jgi:hypothetical protein